jgi:hypothetical protein
MPPKDPRADDLERRLCVALRPGHPDPLRAVDGSCADRMLIALALRHGVDALLAAVLTEAGLVDRMHPAARADLREALLARQRERIALESATLRALEALDRAGLPVMLLKGAALARTLYRNPVERPMNDVDLLVHPAERERAIDALIGAGFAAPKRSAREFWREAYYHLPLRAPGDEEVLVELHWSVAQPERHTVDVTRLFADSGFLSVGGTGCRVPSAPDMLLHLSLHHAYHYFEPRLVWVRERAVLAAVGTDAPEAEALVARAASWGARIPLALAMIQVEKVFPGLLPASYVLIARGSARARWLCRAFGSRHPVELFGGWSGRRRQLLLGALMLDRPRQAVRGVLAWRRRAREFGDRAGRRRELSGADDGTS